MKEIIGEEIRVRKDGTVDVRFHTGKVSFVQQHAKDECDVNTIMRRFEETGQLPGLIRGNPEYGDFSDPVDYQEALNITIKASEQFEALPAAARKRFDNNPKNFLEFCGNAANKEEMAELGLLSEDATKAILTQKRQRIEAEIIDRHEKSKNVDLTPGTNQRNSKAASSDTEKR